MLFFFNFPELHASNKMTTLMNFKSARVHATQAPINNKYWHTTTSNCCLDQRIQLFISSNGKLQVTGSDTFHLQVFGGVSRQLKDLRQDHFSTVIQSSETNSTVLAIQFSPPNTVSLPLTPKQKTMSLFQGFLLWSFAFSFPNDRVSLLQQIRHAVMAHFESYFTHCIFPTRQAAGLAWNAEELLFMVFCSLRHFRSALKHTKSLQPSPKCQIQ